jgi:cytochrome c oxidase cbb3-type subunit III
MPDFTDGFWNIYIAVLCLLGIAGCAILPWSTATPQTTEADHV